MKQKSIKYNCPDCDIDLAANNFKNTKRVVSGKKPALQCLICGCVERMMCFECKSGDKFLCDDCLFYD